MSEKNSKNLGELEKKIRFQVACEERAHQIVEKLIIQDSISEEYLVDAGQHLTPSHYEDITVERAIAKFCGYPICKNQLTKVLKQKYHISTKTNKVYDITDRKNFCSNQCYKASKYFEKQILSSPLWTRTDEPPHPLVLLPLSSNSGSCGEEVIHGSVAIRYEVEKLEKTYKPVKNVGKNQEKRSPKGKAPDNVQMKDESCGDVNQLDMDKLSISDSLEQNNPFPNDGDKISAGLPENGKSHASDSSTTSNHDNDHKLVSSNSIQTDKTMTSDEGSFSKEKLTRVTNDDKDDSHCSEDKENREAVSKTMESDNTNSKMELLMKLLDKRKKMLGKMAQIETVSPCVMTTCDVPVEIPEQQINEDDRLQNSDIHGSHGNCETELDLDSREKQSGIEDTNKCIKHSSENNLDCVEQQSTKKLISEIDTQSAGKEKVKTQPQKGQKTKTIKQKVKPVSTVHLICNSMKDWITMETKQYLMVEDGHRDEEVQERIQFTPDLEKKYRELCHRVDMHETDLDSIIGESRMENPNIERKPVPDFEKLQQEANEFSKKVQGFIQGDLKMKQVKEKETVSNTKVYLPSVDSHDQMLIRKKILMERLNKSMPDLLPPLKLSIQDVFTQLREVISTFKLSSHNILFKPAEWTLVSLILLKLLGRKDLHIACAFLNPSAVNYFSVLLQGIGESLENMDYNISQMML